MRRRVTPELLDSLPPDAPEAVATRRDIRRFNSLLGGFRWLRASLASLLRPGERVVELGAGDGALARHLAPLLRERGAGYIGVDLAPRPPDLPDDLGWEQADLRTCDALGSADVIVANLILHHFDDRDLADLGRRVRARALLASETARRRRFRLAVRLLGPLLHPVSRHDARVSVEAGFRGEELASLLRPEGVWSWSCRTTLFGAHRAIGLRR